MGCGGDGIVVVWGYAKSKPMWDNLSEIDWCGTIGDEASTSVEKIHVSSNGFSSCRRALPLPVDVAERREKGEGQIRLERERGLIGNCVFQALPTRTPLIFQYKTETVPETASHYKLLLRIIFVEVSSSKYLPLSNTLRFSGCCCMTSASELFYTRRSRVGRADQDLGLDSLTPERTFPNRRHHQTTSASTHRHDLDGCDLLRRSPHLRHISHRPSHTERASARFDQGTSQFVSSNPINREISRSTSRPSLNGNERLPGAVLLARARLLERLRGVSISPNRRSGRISFGGYQEENILVMN
ncbi:hypothetical protein LWI28_019750 [Acer negundo]|uniref:Uncharacterized protein n=1 Tax=Acer negundo TaxID=4023 RepID=A0AAD5J178_ACENE|nr:hypothetical protein LWI28_019750 [Acer negundo]